MSFPDWHQLPGGPFRLWWCFLPGLLLLPFFEWRRRKRAPPQILQTPPIPVSMPKVPRPSAAECQQELLELRDALTKALEPVVLECQKRGGDPGLWAYPIVFDTGPPLAAIEVIFGRDADVNTARRNGVCEQIRQRILARLQGPG